jgi:uncharacterized membrane protein
MKIKWKWSDLVLEILAAIPLIFGALRFNALPDQVVSHFDVSGQPNGYMSKLTFLMVFGIISLALPLLMKLLPLLDPRGEHYAKFGRAYEVIRYAITLFFTSVTGVVLYYSLYGTVQMQKFVLVGMGILFAIVGNYFGQIRFNYMVGVRTPWTLANEEVWRRTHRLSGPIWVIGGLVLVFAAFLPGILAAFVTGIDIAFMVLTPIVYSYLSYRKLKHSSS